MRIALLLLLAACSGSPDTVGADFTPSMEAPADVAAAPADANKTESGLAWKLLKSGDGGPTPTVESKVKAHYTGWTTDGKMFDSSREKGAPLDFSLKGVIAGWTEGLQLMHVGDHVRFWIPEELAYKGQAGKPAGMLVFDVELISFTGAPPAPEDVAAPPADATKTASGLAYKVLKQGDGGEKPTEESSVTVHYAGWTTDGKNFDYSRKRGDRPAEFALRGVVAGWTEGLQLMAKGDSYRFWIPEELAYKGQAGKPAGMLVFDVDMIDFKSPPKAPADVAAAPADATKTASGLAYKVLKKGSGGVKPSESAMVSVNYSGWTTDGKNFDYSAKRGAPASFGVGGVIPGWTEGLQLMETGDSVRMWIPEALAYKGQPGRPAGMLVFDVELLDVVEPPDDLTTPPADAQVTETGIKWKLLSEPAATPKKPTPTSRLKFNWLGWTSDKKGFDSNLGGEPGMPRGMRMLKGLQEAKLLLNEGEKARIWIPEELAFKGNPRAPKGMVVYDLELVSIDAK